MRTRTLLSALFLLVTASPLQGQTGIAPSLFFEKHSEMIAMRDGIRLNTEIYVPRERAESLPILFARTPYGLGHDADGYHGSLSGAYRELADDGYIFVFQDIRGRFESEGEFDMIRPPRDESAGEIVDEGTDAHDTIEWLLENVEGHNGKVGILGISYGGWLTVMAMVEPHPAVAAVSPQASPSDMFIGDDFLHNGAFRLAAGFGYAAMMERGKTMEPFQFGQYDAYEWYLDLGPLSRVNREVLTGDVPTWNDFVEHANYDDFWKRQETSQYLKSVSFAVLNVAGWWDAEDFYGPMKIYETLEALDRQDQNFLVVGPWRHGGWAAPGGRTLGDVDFGSATSDYFREHVQAPFFAHYLKGQGHWTVDEALAFQTGSNEWEQYAEWPPRPETTDRELYFRGDGRLSFDPPTSSEAYDQYVSDPAHPVPYRERPMPGFWQGASALWKIADQRFAHHRPDVVSWETDVLEEDVMVSGRIVAKLFASTTGTDADWVVKVIDVYPEVYPDDPEMGGYQVMIADEVLRARFRNSFERPEPVPADEVVEYTIDLNSRNHVFERGHRIMVQVQSTWFPLIDRNPQTFVDNIFEAEAHDFVSTTHRVYRSSRHPSHLVLPVARR